MGGPLGHFKFFLLGLRGIIFRNIPRPKALNPVSDGCKGRPTSESGFRKSLANVIKQERVCFGLCSQVAYSHFSKVWSLVGVTNIRYPKP